MNKAFVNPHFKLEMAMFDNISVSDYPTFKQEDKQDEKIFCFSSFELFGIDGL